MAHRLYPTPSASIRYVGNIAPYDLDAARAIASGLIATIVVTLLLYLVPPVLGLPPIDIEGIIGTAFLPSGGAGAVWLGTVAHVVMSTGLVVIYGATMVWLGQQSTLSSGVVFGALLWLALPMMFLPAVLGTHPLVTDGTIPNPGFFLLDWGYGIRPAVLALISYMIFGAVAAVLYKHAPLD